MYEAVYDAFGIFFAGMPAGVYSEAVAWFCVAVTLFFVALPIMLVRGDKLE